MKMKITAFHNTKSKFYFLIIFVLIFSAFKNNREAKVQKPNIVFILADDCTLWDIGSYGSADSKTPNIDKLAAEGIKFNKCYQSASMCSPTRHNILTGLYPVKSGAYPNHTNAAVGTQSIVHYLKPLGYRVAHSGKRHIGPDEVFPFEYLSEKRNLDFDLIDGFLKNVKETQEPFALMLNSHEPHAPWNKGDVSLFDPQTITLPPNYVDTKETRQAFCSYLAEINYLDGQVGQTMELLKKYGFDDNTLVIFASEQGNEFPFAKWTCYEAGVKSALIARMPGLIDPGSVSDAIVEYTDLLPTFIDLAGGNEVEGLDGKSLVPLFTKKAKKIKDYAYSLQTTRGIANGSEYYGIRAIVNEKYRYIWNLTPEAEFKNIITNSNKPSEWYLSWVKEAKTDIRANELLTKFKNRPREELYDINKDKWCQNNLADDYAFSTIKKDLRKKLLKWMDECGDKGQETEMQAFDHMPSKNH